MSDFEGLKEALEYVVEKTRFPNKTMVIDGKVYANEGMVYIADEEPKIYHCDPLQITTLNGFIDYVKENRDGVNLRGTFAQITGPSSVRLVSVPGEKLERECFINSTAELPQIPFGRWQTVEDFMISLQSSFVPSPDREILMKYVGNIKEDESVHTTDDGISQKIVANTGVATVDTVILPNPVKLRPFRTFQEIEQPESEFVLRIRKGGQIALFEADGGAWKVECRKFIKSALAEALANVEGVCVIS